MFTSSSLPALETGRESAKGLSKPRESLDSQLVLLDEKFENAGDAGDAGESSLKGFDRLDGGGTNRSVDRSGWKGTPAF